jgi:hypothetical protein
VAGIKVDKGIDGISTGMASDWGRELVRKTMMARKAVMAKTHSLTAAGCQWLGESRDC